MASPQTDPRGTSAGGGGLLMNLAIHTVDLMQWSMGEVTVQRVYAQSGLIFT